MKIALCLSGIPRFWESFNLEDYGEVDVFIHSWKEPCSENLCIQSNCPNSKGLEYSWNPLILDKLNPKKVQIDSLEEWSPYFERIKSYFRINEGKCRNSVIPMFFSIYRSIQLAMSGEYDIIVRSRFDIRFLQKIQYIKDETVKIPDQSHYLGVCDQFAYGNPSLMSKYSKTYLYLEQCPDVQLNPEILLKIFLRKQRIKTTLTNDEFVILR